jgi:hypothetical protein
MKGIEAKYTAKVIAKMIKHNRSLERKNRRSSENIDGGYENLVIANFTLKQASRLSSQFRALMIHNAFKKNRGFTTAEVAYFNLGENALNSIKDDKVLYSRYMDRFKRQQKAINIVRHTLLDSNEREAFEKWLTVNAKHETYFTEKHFETA